jgi:ribosome-binding factor A
MLRRELLSACDNLGPDDGVDPRTESRSPWDAGRDRVPNRKALQLCGQVARTLAGVFGECGDAVIRELLIESVVPAPNSSRLLVTVSLPGHALGATAQSPADQARRASQHLERAHGLLRAEVATAIHRRRAPDLLFRVVVPGY